MANRDSIDRAIVLVNGIQRDDLQVVNCFRSLGGRGLDHAEILSVTGIDWRPPSGAAPYNHDTFAADLIGQGCRVVIAPGNPAQPNTQEVIHYGAITHRKQVCGKNRDEIVLVSRLEAWHFGEPITTRPEWLVSTGGVTETQWPWIFNPTNADGVSEGNRSLIRAGLHGERLFLDPEATRSTLARNYQGTITARWTPLEAVFTLCWRANPTETHVKNPTRADLAALPSGGQLLNDLFVPFGSYLPQALDLVLERIGWTWFVAFPAGVPTIRVVEQGNGTAKTISHQRRGEIFSAQQTNAAAIEITADAVATHEAITVLGGPVEYEVTVELKRAWGNNNGTHTPDQLSLTDPTYQNDYSRPREWRDWVLNEGADYVGAGFYAAPTTPNDLVPGLSKQVRRRRFYPGITIHADGLPVGSVGGCLVEWSTDAGATWRPVEELENGECHLLESECGIRFSADEIPFELFYAQSLAKVRITACIRDDFRLFDYVLSATPAAPLGSELVLDEGERFARRTVHTSSQFYSLTPAQVGILTKPERDDRTAMREFLLQTMARVNALDIRGGAVVVGLGAVGSVSPPSQHYELGDVITSVDGRGWDFRATSFADPNFRYPQITAIEYRGQECERHLTLATFRTAPAPAGGAELEIVGKVRRLVGFLGGLLQGIVGK